MRGVSLFRQQFEKEPVKTLVRLLIDYFVYTGMCFFVVFLLLSKWPLHLVDSITGLSVREKLIDLIAKVSRA
jgi:hypothetical protein